jgi:L-ascorbate metabolism protein UlaG (beta-lactamase superfamily)
MKMNGKEVYLRQNVLAEPLLNFWYAWPYLVSPATAAMFVANAHMKIMQSFVAAPQVHVSALKDPAMRGGPFLSCAADKVGDIRWLIERTKKEQGPLLELERDIMALNALLLSEADGSSLEPLYARVPDGLKGYVELTYDTNHLPAFRFIEGLLYKSRYHNPSLQSVALSTIGQDDRPVFFSTPRLKRDGCVHLDLPFGSETLDELFRMKSSPRPYGHIREALGVSAEDEPLFASFFTGEPPRPAERFGGDGVRIRYFGHACVLIETRGANVLTDPVISYQYESDCYRYTFADLPETIDYVLITHSHQDHCIFESLLQLRHKVRNVVVPRSTGGGIADPSLKLVLRSMGFKNVVELDELETIDAGGLSVTSLPFLGEHGDLNIRTKAAYLVQASGRTVLCAADSNNIEPKLYEHISGLFGDIDVLFIGMECEGAPLSWVYGPLLTKPLNRKMDQSRRYDGSDYLKGMDIVNRLRPAHVYVYAMGQEPWLTFLTTIRYTDESRPIVESNKLLADCRARGITAERPLGHKEIFLPAR